MKKINVLSFLAIGLLLLTNCKKESSTPAAATSPTPTPTPTPVGITVNEVNTPIYGKLTATWCGPCGAWGWTLNDEIITEISGRAIPMGLYGSSSSNFTNATVNKWFTDFGGQSYPNFTVNGYNKTSFPPGGGISLDQTKADVISAVDAFIATPVEASTGGSLSWSGQKLTVKSAVKFFRDQTGEFYIGAYMIEDKAKSTQNSQSGIVEHHHVCQGSMGAEIYGIKYTGALTAGTQTDLAAYEFDVPSTWVKENMYVAMIVWKKVGARYRFVNAAKLVVK